MNHARLIALSFPPATLGLFEGAHESACHGAIAMFLLGLRRFVGAVRRSLRRSLRDPDRSAGAGLTWG
jgi:hypothetical protein